MFSLTSKLTTSFVFLGLFLSCSIAQAQILECRDSNGKKMFAMNCPKGYTQIREVEILSPATETKEEKAHKENVKKRLQEREVDFNARQTKRFENEASDRDAQRLAANSCAENRKKLKALLIVGPVEIGKESDGTPIYLDDKKRLEQIASLSEMLSKCGEE